VDREQVVSIDTQRANEILATNDVQRISILRAELIEIKSRVQLQLSSDRYDYEAERADLIQGGMHPREADLRAKANGDADWRGRAAGIAHIADRLLKRVKIRLQELRAEMKPVSRAAVCIAGAGRDGQSAASAINHLLQGGCMIYGAFAIGGDLVIVASDPTREDAS
jgi:hypothetical protein